MALTSESIVALEQNEHLHLQSWILQLYLTDTMPLELMHFAISLCLRTFLPASAIVSSPHKTCLNDPKMKRVNPSQSAQHESFGVSASYSKLQKYLQKVTSAEARWIVFVRILKYLA